VPDAVTMGKPLLLAAALLCTTCGLGWLALAMETHWQQVRGETAASRSSVRVLRALGAAALLLALGLCLRADHPTMAVLVWVMALAGAALLIAFSLSWRPRWLRPLVAWVRPRSGAKG
jgi:Protein of unknown function (DUF3325)